MKAGYSVEITASAERELRSLRDPLLKRVILALRSLASNPRPPGCKKLIGTVSEYRLRIGDYRALYEVSDDENLVIVYHILHRREVYR